MGQNREPIIKFWHIGSTNIWQGSQEYPMRKGRFLQQMVLGKLDIHIQNNEIGPLSHTTPQN